MSETSLRILALELYEVVITIGRGLKDRIRGMQGWKNCLCLEIDALGERVHSLTDVTTGTLPLSDDHVSITSRTTGTDCNRMEESLTVTTALTTFPRNPMFLHRLISDGTDESLRFCVGVYH